MQHFQTSPNNNHTCLHHFHSSLHYNHSSSQHFQTSPNNNHTCLHHFHSSLHYYQKSLQHYKTSLDYYHSCFNNFIVVYINIIVVCITIKVGKIIFKQVLNTIILIFTIVNVVYIYFKLRRLINLSKIIFKKWFILNDVHQYISLTLLERLISEDGKIISFKLMLIFTFLSKVISRGWKKWYRLN